jgi:glycosyltransferase involved in cell wall biosynthesis
MISIGLPAIKPQFLAQAMQSVLDQTDTDFELIVFNDRASSQIREVVRQFTDRRIRYEEGTGALPVVENWNRVLSFARGEYFVLFSDDDRYDPTFLAEMKCLINSYPSCKIFHCRVKKTDPRGTLLACTAECPGFETGLEFIHHRMLGEREQFAPEFIADTLRLRDIGGFVDLPLAWGTDDLTWFQLALDGGIACHPQPLVEWRQSPHQISESGDVKERLVALEKKSVLLQEMVEKFLPQTEEDLKLLAKIKSITGVYEAREKEYLIAVHARNHSAISHISFFFRHKVAFCLKFRWLAYSLFLKMKQGKF